MADRLERALSSLAGEVDYPPTPDLAGRVLERISQGRPRQRTWLRAGRPVVLAAVLVLLVAAVATALTFILPGLRLSIVPSLPTAPTVSPGDRLALGQQVPLGELDVDGPALLGPPSASYVAQDGDVVSLVYAATEELPAMGDSGVGLIIQRIAGSLEGERVEKLVPEVGASVTAVDVGGAAGYWIEGPPHIVRYRSPDGAERTEMTRLAGDTLVWERGGTLYRVESAAGMERTLRLAEFIEP